MKSKNTNKLHEKAMAKIAREEPLLQAIVNNPKRAVVLKDGNGKTLGLLVSIPHELVREFNSGPFFEVEAAQLGGRKTSAGIFAGKEARASVALDGDTRCCMACVQKMEHVCGKRPMTAAERELVDEVASWGGRLLTDKAWSAMMAVRAERKEAAK